MPPETPVTAPLPDPTVAMATLLLVHEPPRVASVRLVVAPAQTVAAPEMAEGVGFTVMIVVVLQPVGNAYVITLVPGAIPVSTPVPDPITATVTSPLLHAPGTEGSVRVTDVPVQTVAGPFIARGSEFTVTVVVAKHPADKV